MNENDNGSNAEPTVNDMLNMFGITPDDNNNPDEGTTTPPDDDSSADTGENNPDENNGTEGDNNDGTTDNPDGEGQQGQQQQQPPAQNPNTAQNQAFARMRTQNAQMQKTIQRMAQVLGLDPNAPMDQLAAAIQQQSTNAIAKQQNIDPRILNRLDELEARDARYRQIEYENTAKAAFEEIQNRFGATPQDLQRFVHDLVQSGYDMAAPGANLVTEFINRNFDAILKYKVDAAVKAEQERSTKASGASQPGTKQGQSNQSDETKDIDSMESMENFLNGLIK